MDKRLVDEVIRTTMKYFQTSAPEYVDKLIKAKSVLKDSAPWSVVELIGDLAIYAQRSGKATHEDIYKALEVFGIIVEEVENE